VVGFFCPVPVSEAKKALKGMGTGEILEVWADDPETLHDMPMLTHRNSNKILSVEERAGELRFLIEVVP
jgi:tRNA 2-thiouridine synthesizing protein A